MAISETNSIKNNKDLTQHFLYTYSNIQKLGPRETTRLEFNDDLIFDRSRKTIFTQSQEFGYVSDTVYTLSVGNDYNNGESKITLRSYEGNIEFYKFDSLVITDIDLANKKEIYSIRNNFNLSTLSFSYVGSGKISFAEISLNGIPIYSSDEINAEYGFATIYNIDYSNKLIHGKNTLSIYAYSDGLTYKNTDPELQHNTYPRFQPININTESEFSIDFYAYNLTYILEVPGTYWSIMENPDVVSLENNVTYTFLTDNYYSDLRNNPYICTNTHNSTLCLGIPSRLESNDIIYGSVGGSSVEMYKLKEIDKNKIDGIDNYTIYVSTSDNWANQEFYVKKNNSNK